MQTEKGRKVGFLNGKKEFSDGTISNY